MSDTFTMPATHCPRWCLEDHQPAWQEWVEAVTPGPGAPADGWEPYHRLRVGTVTNPETAHETFEVDLVRGGTELPYLFMEGYGCLDGSTARQLAALLLDAADELDKATG